MKYQISLLLSTLALSACGTASAGLDELRETATARAAGTTTSAEASAEATLDPAVQAAIDALRGDLDAVIVSMDGLEVRIDINDAADLIRDGRLDEFEKQMAEVLASCQSTTCRVAVNRVTTAGRKIISVSGKWMCVTQAMGQVCGFDKHGVHRCVSYPTGLVLFADDGSVANVDSCGTQCHPNPPNIDDACEWATLTPPSGNNTPGTTPSVPVPSGTPVTPGTPQTPPTAQTPSNGSTPSAKNGDEDIVIIYDGRIIVVPPPPVYVINYFINFSPGAPITPAINNWLVSINVDNIDVDQLLLLIISEWCKSNGCTLPVTPEPDDPYPGPATATPRPPIIVDPDPTATPPGNNPPGDDGLRVACNAQVIDLGDLPRWVITDASLDSWFHPIFNIGDYENSGGALGQWSWANTFCLETEQGGSFRQFWGVNGEFRFRMDQQSGQIAFWHMTASSWNGIDLRRQHLGDQAHLSYGLNIKTVRPASGQTTSVHVYKDGAEWSGSPFPVSPEGDITFMMPYDGVRRFAFDVVDPAATHETIVHVGPIDRWDNINLIDIR